MKCMAFTLHEMKHCYVGRLFTKQPLTLCSFHGSLGPKPTKFTEEGLTPGNIKIYQDQYQDMPEKKNCHPGHPWLNLLNLQNIFSSWGMACHDDSTRPVLPEWQRAARQGVMISTSSRNSSCPQVPQGTDRVDTCSHMCTYTPHGVDCCACPHLREHTTLSSPLSCK